MLGAGDKMVDKENIIYYSFLEPAGFRCTDLYGEIIPPGCQILTQEQYGELYHGVNSGKLIIPNEKGFPILVDPPISTLIAKQIELIKAERDRRLLVCGYEVNGQWFKSDPLSRSQQHARSLQGEDLPAGIEWETLDGADVEITPDLVRAVLAAEIASDDAISAHAKKLIEAVKNSLDPLEVNLYQGWPKGFGE